MGPSLKGIVNIYTRDLQTGEICDNFIKDNIITYSGPDILAKLMAGDDTYVPNYVYFEYSNASSPSIVVPTPTRSSDYSYYSGLTGSAGYVEAPLVLTPTLTATSASYDHNEVTFHCQVNYDATEVAGASFTTSSKVIGGALVSRINEDDPTQDLIFSRFYFATNGTGAGAITNTANMAIGINWTIKIL